MVPSVSVPLPLKVISWPTIAGLGEMLSMVAVGASLVWTTVMRALPVFSDSMPSSSRTFRVAVKAPSEG